jgi:di/tricarboxylate transporter
MSPRTMLLAKLIGLFLAILALTMFANRTATVAAFIGLAGDAPTLGGGGR